MADSSLRLLLLLRHIPREPTFIGTQQLQNALADAGHEVSLRTIQRDLQSLSVYFPLTQNTPQGRGKTGLGWAFMRDSQSLSFPVMGSAAALTLSMALQHLQQLLPAQALQHLEPLRKEAENLLSGHNDGQYQSWMDKVRTAPQHALLPPTIEAEVMDQVYRALLENRQLKATYLASRNALSTPTVWCSRGIRCTCYAGFISSMIFASLRCTVMRTLRCWMKRCDRFPNLILMIT